MPNVNNMFLAIFEIHKLYVSYYYVGIYRVIDMTNQQQQTPWKPIFEILKVNKTNSLNNREWITRAPHTRRPTGARK